MSDLTSHLCEECEAVTVLLGPGDDWAICADCHARLSSMTAEDINREMGNQ